MLSNMHNTGIYDSTFTMNQHNHYNYVSNRGLDTLKAAVAIRAFHNSEERFDPPKCHSRTREAVLARIMRWARRETDLDKPIMWVYGAAGTGKSAIEQTIAELCDAEDGDIFVCSFFFSGSDGSRNHSKAFVPTIAYQMAVATPSLRPLIDAALERDPLLLSKSLEVQMMRLIIQPFQRLLTESYSEVAGRYFIIIDGLDECMDGSRMQLIEGIQRLVTIFEQGSKFIASFASRAEPDIKSAFMYTSVSGIVTRVALDDDYRADEDIRLFLSDKFAVIQRTRPRISRTWPTEDQLDKLVRNASGQFIYASTVHNFVSSPHHNPMKRLDIVLGLAPANGSLPFAQLDALYRQILLSAPPDCVDEGIRVVITIHVMCSLGSLKVSIFAASRIVELEEYDFMTHLDNYASIIGVDDDGHARPFHASLGDFLFDPQRSSDLYTDPRAVHTHISERLMRYLASPLWESEISENREAPFLLYAFTTSIEHLFQAKRTRSVLEHLRLIFKPSFLENVTNAPTQGPWSMSHRVFMAVGWLFLPLQRSLLPDLKDPGIAEEYHNAVRQLISTFMAKDTPENNRLLKLLVTMSKFDHALQRLMLPYEKLYAGLQTLFHHEVSVLYVLSTQPIILDYFDNPLLPATQRLLQPSECLTLAVQLLLYLHNNVLPGTITSTHSFLVKRTHHNILPSSRKYRATVVDFDALNDGWSTYWPKYPVVEAPCLDALAKNVAASVVSGARLALYFLPFVLLHAPPTSYRLLQLCQNPNINRFPWCVSRKHARTAANAMKKYRHQFLPNRVSRREPVQSSDLLPVPGDDVTVQDLTEQTHRLLEVS